MKVICAGCGLELGERPAESLGPDSVSHGVCEPCAIRFLAKTGVPVGEYIESLPLPTVLLTAEVAVNSANSSALSLLGKEPADLQGRPGGEVFECMYAELPEGCGKTVHCSGCTIRNTVMDTWETGDLHLRVPAYLQQSPGGVTTRLKFLISAEKKGGMVFLRIEEIGAAGKEES